MDFESLFKREFERLGSLVMPLVMDPQEVEVMASEAFARLWEKRDRVYKEDAIVDFLENAMLSQAVRFMVDNRKKSPDSSKEDNKGDLPSLLASLPTHARASWVLARDGNLDFVEIGEMLDLSAETVAKQLGKAFRLIYKGMTGDSQPADLDLKAWASLCEGAGKVLAGEGESSLQSHPTEYSFAENHPQIAVLKQLESWWQAGASQGLTFNSAPDQQWNLFVDIVPAAKGGKIIDYDKVRRRKKFRQKWKIRIIIGSVIGVILFLLFLLIRWIV
jgi:DNA-directed RNA polymerase specialized sigma24 family protein